MKGGSEFDFELKQDPQIAYIQDTFEENLNLFENALEPLILKELTRLMSLLEQEFQNTREQEQNIATVEDNTETGQVMVERLKKRKVGR